MYSGLLSAVKTLEQCRAKTRGDNGGLSDTQFEARFNLMSALPYLVNFTQHPNTPFALGSAISDLYSYQYSLWNGAKNEVSGYQMAMPPGCQLADWLSTGTCRVQFAGLQSLLGDDVTVRLQIQKCPANLPGTFNCKCPSPVHAPYHCAALFLSLLPWFLTYSVS